MLVAKTGIKSLGKLSKALVETSFVLIGWVSLKKNLLVFLVDVGANFVGFT